MNKKRFLNRNAEDDRRENPFDEINEIPDASDDLRLNDLLEKYTEDAAEQVDASVYSEFADEIYSDEDAERAAGRDAAFDEEAEVYGGYREYEGYINDRDDGCCAEASGAEPEEYAGEGYAADAEYAEDDDSLFVTEFRGEDAADEYDGYDTDTAMSDDDDSLYVTEFKTDDSQDADAYMTEYENSEEYLAAQAAKEQENAYYAEEAEDAYASGEEYAEGGENVYYDGTEYAGNEYAGTEYADGAYAQEDGYAENPDVTYYAEPEDYDNAAYDEAYEEIAEGDAPMTDADGDGVPDFVNYEEQEEALDIDEGIDSTDINLMLAFGLDEELERTMGADAAKKLTAELDEEQRKRDERVRKTVDNEYMNRTQTAGFAKEYKTKYRNIKIKLIIASIFAVVLFFYENLRLFGYELSGAFDAAVYPTVYIMGSLQILLFCAACAYEQIFEGFANFFTGRIDSKSITSIATAGAIIYCAILTRVTKLAHIPHVVNFAVALLIVFTLVADYFNIRREIFAFNIVSSKRPKHIVSHIAPDYESENYDPEAGDMLKFETASFIDNYFTRTKEPTRTSRTYATAALIISLVSAVAAGVFTKMTSSAEGVLLASAIVENAFSSFFVAIPVSMLITMSYPFYRASRDAYDNDGAIIGETSLEEYSDAGCVTFDDTGVFPSYGVRVHNVKIYNNHRIDRVLYYAASVFATARGPLTDVFEVATVELGHSDNVRIKAAGTGYLATSVDEKNITFGSAAELVSRGFDLPEEITDEDENIDDDVSVMYMFREDRLMAKMFIKYTLDSDFEAIMAALCEEGISVSVKTYDPNIDDALIAAGVAKDSEYSYSVTRYGAADDGSSVKENADSGIVSRGSARTLLQMISDCTKVLASRRAGIVIGIISAVVSALLMTIVILSGRVDSMTSGMIALYQLFWLIPTFICAHMYVR